MGGYDYCFCLFESRVALGTFWCHGYYTNLLGWRDPGMLCLVVEG